METEEVAMAEAMVAEVMVVVGSEAEMEAEVTWSRQQSAMTVVGSDAVATAAMVAEVMMAVGLLEAAAEAEETVEEAAESAMAVVGRMWWQQRWWRK